MITAAISVLSAIEGIGIATPALNRFVLPLAIALRGSKRFEPLHFALSSPHDLMGVFGAIVFF
jgi:hypothetical protein